MGPAAYHGATGGCDCQSDCYSEPCSCGCGSEGNCPAGDMLDAVKCAKKTLLKEKIKARLEAQMGKKLDAAADLAVEMYMGKMEMKKMKHEKMDEMMQKMSNLMNQ